MMIMMNSNQTIIRKNERSWAIEMISQINALTERENLVIKHAGGETTVSEKKGKSMFPDVILYEDDSSSVIIQGWELKMPDVPITDEAFINDAQRKAVALHLNTCVIWNFTYAQLYVQNQQTKAFEVVKQWENPHILTRDDVETYRDDWQNTLREVVLDVNEYLLNNRISKISIEEVISNNAINLLVTYNKSFVANSLRQECQQNQVSNAVIQNWWSGIKSEYIFDENDAFNAYAKTIILNWAYRILFAHLIKRTQKDAFIINTIDYDTSPEHANEIFETITSTCDFYNVFEKLPLDTIIPEGTWSQLVELSLFLSEYRLESIDQRILQNILEGCVKTSRRELKGQFTTPPTLARILARLTIHNLHGNVADICCGTGTIAHEIINLKKDVCSPKEAAETTWASDKYRLPLQIANISMASYDTINIPNRIFQRNALALKTGQKIEVVDPSSGSHIELSMPKFHAICSNLPFVAFENIPGDDEAYFGSETNTSSLLPRSDLSFYIALAVSDLLDSNGRLGIILSNSWLATEAGNRFYHLLKRYYNIEQVHISGNGRWFKNADIVTTILILQKRNGESNNNTRFYLWKVPLNEIRENRELEDTIVNSALLNQNLNDDYISVSSYDSDTIDRLRSFNISYNALFHHIAWLQEVEDSLIPIQRIFKVFRGSRRGWDPLFFPTEENDIDECFLHPASFNARRVTRLIAEPDRKAFCCSKDLDELRENYIGTYNWVMKFSTLMNSKGDKPLVEVLARTNMKWYEMRPNEVADIFTMMNPDQRLFFGKYVEPAFINQRLIGLQRIADDDIDLCHALLNTILMKFFIEAAGFGRGLGVLDINKDNIAACYMLNPRLLSEDQAREIKEHFVTILNKDIKSVEAELNDPDWISYNKAVLRAYSMEHLYEPISKSYLSMMTSRRSIRN